LENRLPGEFVRIHRSFIVNKLMIKEIQKHFKGTYVFVMNDPAGTKITSAGSYSESIKQQLLIP
jgi:two-component system LytT family response regulator